MTEGAEWDLLKSRPFVQVSCFSTIGLREVELMDDGAAGSLPVPLPPEMLGRAGAPTSRPDRITNRKTANQYSTKLRELLTSHFILLSKSHFILL